MKIFGIEIGRRRKSVLSGVPTAGFLGGGWGVIAEPFGGAWQRNIQIDSRECILAFSAVFACVTRIASDIAKMPIKLLEKQPSGIWAEVADASP